MFLWGFNMNIEQTRLFFEKFNITYYGLEYNMHSVNIYPTSFVNYVSENLFRLKISNPCLHQDVTFSETHVLCSGTILCLL